VFDRQMQIVGLVFRCLLFVSVPFDCSTLRTHASARLRNQGLSGFLEGLGNRQDVQVDGWLFGFGLGRAFIAGLVFVVCRF
jgi:hypothetical protein